MTEVHDPVQISARLSLLLQEETVIPSPHSIDLQRTTETDFLQRPLARSPHVAELYHVNSKLSPYSTLQIPDDPRVHGHVRGWFFDTAYKVEDGAINPEHEGDIRIKRADLPAPLAGLLAPFMRPGPVANLLYGIDMLLCHQGRVTKVIPHDEYLWLVRLVEPADEARFKAALLELPPMAAGRAEAFLVLVACPWRYMVMYGPRGYRHTLVDAGRVIHQLELLAPHHGWQLAVTQNFYDVQVDRFVLMDGVERSAVAVLALERKESE